MGGEYWGSGSGGRGGGMEDWGRDRGNWGKEGMGVDVVLLEGVSAGPGGVYQITIPSIFIIRFHIL